MSQSLGQTVIRFGIPLVLGGAGYVAYLSNYEDGPPKSDGTPRFKNVVYADNVAGGIPTACVGLTKAVSPVPVVLGDYWSDQQCWSVGSKVAGRGQAKVLTCIKVPVIQSDYRDQRPAEPAGRCWREKPQRAKDPGPPHH